MKEYDYVPTEQDLKDFEEYNIPTSTSNRTWTFVHCNKTFELSRETICTIVSDLLANCYSKETIESIPLIERLTVLALFGYDLNQLLRIICSDLSENEFKLLCEGKEYPYLVSQLRSVVGNENLEYVRTVYNHLKGTHILPYKQFYNDDWSVTNEHLTQVRYELISIKSCDLRPMWCCRIPVMFELGIGEDKIRSREIVEVDCVKFFKSLFNWNKHLLSDFRCQFGIPAQYNPRTNSMKFTISYAYLRLVECYFNVKFIKVPPVKTKANDRGKKSCFDVKVLHWNDADR